ncbi:MAG: hypothetical protein A4E57_03330 [Syntrophorhabdaceae bacterium PtaU1.Bin034]|nr:MAG: hypothetical protein A4E57_03330 [Syntrophorhabdaceae bacterium PtaU1.Bin034]
MKKQSQRTIHPKVIEEAQRFFSENRQAICDYARQAGLSFEAGDRWSIDMSTGRGTFDPGFFYKRGFTLAESMWATCHEIEHFRDWRKDPEGYARLFSRMKKGKRRLDLLYHMFNDIMVNREEDRRFPAHWETREYLYTYKLLPRTDHSTRPRHLQFIDGILREKMVPREEVTLSPEVRAEVERLKNIDGEGTDVIELVSDAAAKPGDRFELIQDYIEPVYERLFYEDVEERKRQKKQKKDVPEGDAAEASMDGAKGATGKAEIEVDPESGEDYFAEEYDQMDERLPQVLSAEDVSAAIREEIERLKNESKTPGQIAKEQFRALHGVSIEEVEDYADHYAKVKPHIQPLRDVFERVIETRKEIRRRLKERTDQGVIIDPSFVAQAYIDSRAGIIDSRTQLNIRKEELDEHKPLDFEFTLICDLSGSMNENRPGGKSYEQRLCTILITEALDEFERKLKAERIERLVDLRVFSEVRGFGSHDEELKPMSDSVDYYTRVRICKRLEACTGKRTAEYKSLTRVAARLEGEAGNDADDRDIKRAVVLITDGGSDDPALTREAKERLGLRGCVVRGIQIGEPSTEDVEKFRYAWGDDGLPCKDVSRLVPTMEKLLEDLLETHVM